MVYIYIYIYLLLHIYIIYPTKHFKFPINTWNQYVNINHWIYHPSHQFYLSLRIWRAGDPGDRHGSSKSFTMRCESSSFRSVSASKGPARSEAVSFGQRWSMESMASVAGFPSIAYIICAIICIYWLVVSSPLKNRKISWDDYSKYMEKCSKPPTNIYIYNIYIYILSCKTHTHLTIANHIIYPLQSQVHWVVSCKFINLRLELAGELQTKGRESTLDLQTMYNYINYLN